MHEQSEKPQEHAITQDLLLGGRVILRQPAQGYRASIDPLLLAATVNAIPGDTILDVGAGVGTVGLCLAARLPYCKLWVLNAKKNWYDWPMIILFLTICGTV